MPKGQQQQIDAARVSLERIQKLNASDYVRSELGRSFNFEEAKPIIERLVEFFRRLSTESLDLFPRNQLNEIKNAADACFNVLEEVRSFDEKAPNSVAIRQALIVKLQNQEQHSFNALFPLITFALANSVDFSKIDQMAHASMQSFQDVSQKIITSLTEKDKQADEILKEIRQTAAEQGVTQQAIYFQQRADAHEREADKWRNWTVTIGVFVGLFALGSFFLHDVPWFSTTSPYDTVQLIVTKIGMLFVLVFWLVLCAKAFLSSKHNAIVNRHRQTALQTYKTLVDAASDPKSHDIVLTYAATCIFSPQPTGFVRNADTAPNVVNRSIFELLPMNALSHINQ